MGLPYFSTHWLISFFMVNGKWWYRQVFAPLSWLITLKLSIISIQYVIYMLNDLCILPMLCLSSANKFTLLVVRDGHQKDPNEDDGQSWGLELMKWYSAIEEIFSSILKSCNVLLLLSCTDFILLLLAKFTIIFYIVNCWRRSPTIS